MVKQTNYSNGEITLEYKKHIVYLTKNDNIEREKKTLKLLVDSGFGGAVV